MSYHAWTVDREWLASGETVRDVEDAIVDLEEPGFEYTFVVIEDDDGNVVARCTIG